MEGIQLIGKIVLMVVDLVGINRSTSRNGHLFCFVASRMVGIYVGQLVMTLKSGNQFGTQFLDASAGGTDNRPLLAVKFSVSGAGKLGVFLMLLFHPILCDNLIYRLFFPADEFL